MLISYTGPVVMRSANEPTTSREVVSRWIALMGVLMSWATTIPAKLKWLLGVVLILFLQSFESWDVVVPNL